MDEEALSRIRLVTQRYHELKGLFPASLGLSFCLMASAVQLNLVLIVPVIVILILFLGYWLDEKYYPSRFGRVRRSPDTAKWQWTIPFGILAVIFVDQRSLGKGLPALVPLLILSQSAWIVIRDWPLRMHHLVTVWAGLLSSLLYTRTGKENETEWFIASGLLFGIAFAISGLADHRLLAATLDGPLANAEESDESAV